MNKSSYIEELSQEIIKLDELKIIKNLFLIIGGGKYGNIALDYAKKKNYPFIIIIDKEKKAINSEEIKIIHNLEEYQLKINEFIEKSNPLEKKKNVQQEILFLQSEIDIIPFLFSFGIPELLVPVVPLHISAYLFLYFLHLPLTRYIEKKTSSNPIMNQNKFKNQIIEQLKQQFIGQNVSEFQNIITNELPKDIILESNSDEGVILLSWAHLDEVCPSNCVGPPNYCPNFQRRKNNTITDMIKGIMYSKNNEQQGWFIESHQAQPGLGIILGDELIKMINSIMKFLEENIKLKIEKEKREKPFFIATTCNCHGILNIFSILPDY